MGTTDRVESIEVLRFGSGYVGDTDVDKEVARPRCTCRTQTAMTDSMINAPDPPRSTRGLPGVNGT